MKTKEELNALKEEVEALNRKLAELTEEELEQVSGGFGFIGHLVGPDFGPGGHALDILDTSLSCSAVFPIE